MQSGGLQPNMSQPGWRCRLLSLFGLLLCSLGFTIAAQGTYLGCFNMGDGSVLGCDIINPVTDNFLPISLGATFLDSLGTAKDSQDCIARGSTLGYLYIAIVNYWCFATNTPPAKTSLVSADKCTTVCPGDATAKCGGACQFSVYATGATGKPAAPSLSGVQELGCFPESPCKSIQDFLYGRKMSYLGSLGTPQECQRRAIQLGYAYASMQFAYECFASNVDPVALFNSPTTPQQCYMPCRDDVNQTCGGPCFHSVYSTGLKPAVSPTSHNGFPANYQGCFSDPSCGQQDKPPPRKIDLAARSNQTAQGCKQAVLETLTPGQYKYYAVLYSPAPFGLDGATECWAIDTPPEYIFGPAVPDDQCFVPCPDNSAVMCGGPCFASVYQLDIAISSSPEASNNITFTILLQASAQLASNATLQTQLLTQLQANLAQFLSVTASQVMLTFRSVGRSRMLLQALAPFAVDTTVLGNTTQLQQQVSSLQAAAAQLAYGVSNAIQLDASSISIVLSASSISTPLLPSSSVAPSTSPTSSTSKAGIIAAAVVVPVVVLTLLLGAAVWWRHKRQQQQQRAQSTTEPLSSAQTKHSSVPPESLLSPDASSGVSDAYAAVQIQVTQDGLSSQASAGGPPDMPKWLVPGDPFEDTACQYAWADIKPGNVTAQVESAVNDVQLDTQSKDGSCPVVELSSADVKQQLQLVFGGLLGRGSAAVVLTCRWPSRFGPHALLAAKVMTKTYPANPSIVQSFAHEANLLTAIRHPHVVRLYGYCLELPTVCLIMELLPGSLEDLLYKGLCKNPSSSHVPTSIDQKAQLGDSAGTALESNTPAEQSHSHETLSGRNSSKSVTSTNQRQQQPHQQLNMADVLRIATDVAAGLAYLHNRQVTETGAVLSPRPEVAGMREEIGMPTWLQESYVQGEQSAKVVHRDLKPANILITSQGRAKISDFGLAREYATTTVHTVHVGAGTMIYQAPELLSGHAGPQAFKPTNRCDVYSLGIMMWELLAREKPWRGLTVGQLVSQVCAKKRPPIPITATVSGSQQQANRSDQPASFEALPELVDLIRACWRHRDLKRPTAAEVHERLCNMLERAQQRAVGLPLQHTAAS